MDHEQVARQARERGHPPPAYLVNRPSPRPELAGYWRAWCELSTCRHEGHSFVPWTAVDAYAARHEMDRRQAAVLVRVCRALDDTVNTHMSERAAAGAAAGGGPRQAARR